MLSCLGSVVSAAVKDVCFEGNRIPEQFSNTPYGHMLRAMFCQE